MDIFQRGDLPFPQSLPEFQRLFPDDAACATYLEKARWKAAFMPTLRSLRLAIPLREPPRRPALPQLPQEHRPHRGYGDGAIAYAAQCLVLGGVSRLRPNARDVCRAVPAPDWTKALGDSIPNMRSNLLPRSTRHSPDRFSCGGCAGRPLWPLQGFRRGSRGALCLQAWHLGAVHPHRLVLCRTGRRAAIIDVDVVRRSWPDGGGRPHR